MLRRLVVFAFVCILGCSRQAPPAHVPDPNILLITIDTLRADRLGRGLTPAIDALATRGTRFMTARAVVPLTLPSHVSIMTGALPADQGVRLNGGAGLVGERATIARVLHGGYRTGAFVGAYVLDRRFGLSGGFDTYDDRVERDSSGAATLESQRRGDVVTSAALAWLAADTTRPFFAWIHLYDPHAPYEPPAEYLAKAHGNAYDGEVAFADAQVGRLLDWLRASGQQSRTIVALAGDHGEGLGDHGEQTHGMLAYDSTLRVPLVLAGPGVPARVDEEAVSLVALAGTLLQLAHRQPPQGIDTASLIAPHPRDRDLYAETEYPKTAGWHPLAALVDGRWKLIASSENELYDLVADPGETRNQSTEKSALVSAMRKRAQDLAAPRAAQTSPTVSAEADERLRALGYVSGSPTLVSDQTPNPARGIYAWNTFERELSRLTRGDARGALPGLGKLARAYPDSPVFQATYARALKDTGRVREAVDIYRRLIARWPQDPSLYHDLAVAAGAAGMASEAARAEQAALALNPADAEASNGLGLLRAQAGNTADAVKAFEQAVTIDPSNAVYWTNLGNARRAANDAEGAERAYRTALERNSRSVDAANGLGVLLVQGHRAAEAIPWFDRALAASPAFIEARLNLGIAYQESGNAAAAVDQYRRVLQTAAPGSREYVAAEQLLKGVSGKQ